MPAERDQLLRQGVCDGCGAEIPQRGNRRRRWCSQRCRKRTLYSGTCRRCGATTNGYGGPGTASDLCVHCAPKETARWTCDAIVTAMRSWAAEHGRPPVAGDWSQTLARQRNRPARSGEFPATSMVLYVFGSWNAAVESAGLEVRPNGKRGGRVGDDPTARAKAAELYASGMSSYAVAAELGMASATVLIAAREAGVTIRPCGGWHGR